MMVQISADRWASAAAYEPYVGRWSRLVARQFIGWLAVVPGADWVDVGCGTGALTGSILAEAAPDSVRAADASAAYVGYARAHTRDSRAVFAAADARALPWHAASVDVVVSGLVLNFIPEPERALTEMVRIARPGGVVAAYVWDYAEGMQLMRHFWDAAIALDPEAAALDEGRRFPLCQPAPLAALWQEAGLRHVAGAALEVPTRFRDFDDFWNPFLGGQGPAPGYAMRLDAERRERLRERIRSGLPVSPDGSIALTARAFAVRGVRA